MVGGLWRRWRADVRAAGWQTIAGYVVCVLSWFLTLTTVAFVSFVMPADGQSPAISPPWIVLDALIGLAMIVWMRARHRHPLALALVYGLLSGVVSTAAMPAIWAFIHLATRRRARDVALVAVVFTGSGLFADMVLRHFIGGAFLAPAAEDLPPSYYVLTTTLALLFTMVLIAIGYYIGARRDLLTTLRERAETAEREQELRVMQGQASERNRIAREMHDVLAHRMSLVSMHAGALAYRDDLSSDETRAIAQVIQENAHASLSELRGVLGSLRGDEPTVSLPPEKPQPTLQQLGELLDEARSGGQRIEVKDSVEHPELLPSLTGRHAYRVVQEAITNARKHAPNAKLTLDLAGGPGRGLTITGRNPLDRSLRRGDALAVPGSGVGLLGLRERAQITGGRIRHAVLDDGTFELTVWLPW
ncbi:sensor histidine kinase [Aestuariimicrobium ganziense]|uniref:sensor histidine kinase n=1 Tax=Aestuariimicrobium ganziense TaxID=2773677 RepID=UPI001941ACE5|nr:histidine kinase [Aestuariimicrobium ganziense]